jgi:hypothetical protein
MERNGSMHKSSKITRQSQDEQVQIPYPFCEETWEDQMKKYPSSRQVPRKGKRDSNIEINMDAEELQQMIRELPLKQVAEWYGISQKGVESWCQVLGIASPFRGDLSHADCDITLQEVQE